MAFYPISKSEGNHANPTHTFNFQIEVLFGIKQQTNLQKSIQIHTTQNWMGTLHFHGLLVSSHNTALRCIWDVLMGKISTLLNYILSQHML